MKLVHVKRMTTWCLHKFPHNAYSHVQQTYLVKGSGTLYVIFGCCWFHTIHAWLVLFESFISWVICVWGINMTFSIFAFTMCFTTFFFYKPTCVVCYTIHNGGHYLLEHLQMFVLLEFYTIYRSMFVIFSCHNFLNLLIVFCHPLIPWLCSLYDPSPISVPRAPFICCLSKFFLQAFNPSSLSIPIPCLLNQHS